MLCMPLASAGQPAARVGDMTIDPSSVGPIPCVGGAILPPGVPTVLIAGLPAATMDSTATTACGLPATITTGSATVLIGNKPAARMGDSTDHGGSITNGAPTVLIGQ